MQEFITYLTGILGTLLVLYERFARSELGRYVLERLKAQAEEQARRLIGEHAYSVASYYQQTVVAELKQSARDGKITPDELKASLLACKERARSDLLEAVEGGFLQRAVARLGIAKVPAFVERELEAAIYRLKEGRGAGVYLPGAGQLSGQYAAFTAPSPAQGTKPVEVHDGA